MKKIAFICLGNICRSPMAEFLFRAAASKAGRERDFEVESFATSSWELGNPVYPPIKRILDREGINCSGKRAQVLKRADCDRLDLIVCMDKENLRDAKEIAGKPNADKCVLFNSFNGNDTSVADPWYTERFEECYEEISFGVEAMLSVL